MIAWFKKRLQKFVGVLRFAYAVGFFSVLKFWVRTLFNKRSESKVIDVNDFPVVCVGDENRFRKVLENDLVNFKTRDDDIFVVAYPKCGQHWAYDFINMLVNGNLELDNKIKETTFLEIFAILGSGFDSLHSLASPRVIYTHFPASLLPKEIYTKNRKIIRLIRNPKDVYVSAFYHYNQMLVELVLDAKNLPWSEFIEGAMDIIEGISKPSLESKPFIGRGQNWFEFELDSEEKMNNLDNTLVLYYEDLKEDMPNQLKKLATFLGKEYDEDFYEKIAEKTNLAYIMKHKDLGFYNKKDGGLYRKGVIGDWKNHFTASQNIRFNDIMEQKMRGCPIMNKIRFEAGQMT